MTSDGELAAKIARLEAKDEIRELTARYCHGVVDGDADTIVSLFCTEGTFRSHTFSPTGHEALLEFYRSGVGGRTHKPFIQNHVIEFSDENHATGRCSVEIRVLQDGLAYTQAGHYHDTYRRENGVWKFVERYYIRYHDVPWVEGWTK